MTVSLSEAGRREDSIPDFVFVRGMLVCLKPGEKVVYRVTSLCAHRAGALVDGPDSGIIGVVVSLLEDDSPKVRARALGTVHNLSTDARSIGIIREEVRLVAV